MRIAVKVLIVYGDTDTDEYITLCFMNGVLLMQPARSRVYVTVGCPSVCPSVRLSVSSMDNGCRLLSGQDISVDSRGRRAAGAGAPQQMRVASC